MARLRVLEVSGYGVRLGASGGSLTVKEKDGEQRYPLSEVDMVIVATSGVSVSSRAVRLLARAGIDLVFLDWRGMPVAMLYSSEPTLTVDTKRAQYKAYFDGRGQGIAREIVSSKLHNQAVHLERLYLRLRDPLLRVAGEAIRAVEEEVYSSDVGDAKSLMVLEARAAREYWGALSHVLPRELGFRGRDHDSDDPVNIVLNYAYGVLYGFAWRALVLAGLDPYAGFLHVDRSGKPVLVFDYVECWRPVIVDQVLVQYLLAGWRPDVRDGRLMPSDRSRITGWVKERLDKLCSSGYRRMSCGEALRGYAARLAKSLREGGEFKCYRGW